LNVGRFNEGINALVKGIQLYPENAQAYFYLGYAYAIQGNRNNAGIYLQKAVNLNPGYGQQAQDIMNKMR
jgi:tetratricopeptide (TPR) repeat protein